MLLALTEGDALMKAVWEGIVVAESKKTIEMDGHFYFPPSSVKKDLLREGTATTTCPVKGKGIYLDILVGDRINKDAAWRFSKPKKAANRIKNYVAFWRSVELYRDDGTLIGEE